MATLNGTSTANHLIGTNLADLIRGYGGNDILEGLGGNDKIYGGGGNDTITGGTGNDTLSGGAGSDLFLFGAGDGQDVITDLGLGDVVQVSGYTAAQSISQVGTDVVVTLSATDKLTFSGATVQQVQAQLHFGTTSGGGTGTSVTGTEGNDLLNGTSGNDTVQGLGGNDTIRGGAGDDRIYGGLGADILDGGAGRDTYVYTSTSESPNRPQGAQDLIQNWSSEDRIDLSAIDANTLVAGNQAFTFAGYAFNDEFLWHGAGNLYIGGYDNDLWVIGFTDNDSIPDFMITLSAPAGESSLTAGNLVL